MNTQQHMLALDAIELYRGYGCVAWSWEIRRPLSFNARHPETDRQKTEMEHWLCTHNRLERRKSKSQTCRRQTDNKLWTAGHSGCRLHADVVQTACPQREASLMQMALRYLKTLHCICMTRTQKKTLSSRGQASITIERESHANLF